MLFETTKPWGGIWQNSAVRPPEEDGPKVSSPSKRSHFLEYVGFLFLSTEAKPDTQPIIPTVYLV
jgi:hypothetical protein